MYYYRVNFTHTFVVVRALIVILMVIEVGTFYCRVVNEITGLFIPHRKQRKIQMRWDDVNNSLSFSTNTFYFVPINNVAIFKFELSCN